MRLLDLAPGGVCLAADIAADAGGLLHHRFTLADVRPQAHTAIYLSVALSIGLLRLAVSQRRALWSADFPQPVTCTSRDHPANLDNTIISGQHVSGNGFRAARFRPENRNRRSVIE